MSHNQVTLLGRLSADPAIKYTQSGTPVLTFTIAVDRPYKNGDSEKKVDWISCVAWRGSGENISKHFRKGHRILVSGQLQIRNWTDGDGHKRRNAEVLVNGFEFIERRSGDAPHASAASADDDNGYTSQITGSPFRDIDGYEGDGDDLPF